MTSTATYNGYESYDHWNTALWINNDEKYYNDLKEMISLAKRLNMGKDDVAGVWMQKYAGHKTPDGAEWQQSTVLELVEELWHEH